MQIARDITAVDFEGRVWAYLCRQRGGFTLIDAGIAGRLDLLVRSLQDVGAELMDVQQIVLTHFHKDHAGNVAELQSLTGARTLAHVLDAPVVRGDATAAEPSLSGPEQIMFDYFAKDLPDAPPAAVHEELSDGVEIDVGAAARVVHLPGHTDGSIGLYLPAEGIVFTGDAAASVNGRPIVGVFNVDREQAKRSFRLLGELEIDIACFGHGRPITSDAAVLFRDALAGLEAPPAA